MSTDLTSHLTQEELTDNLMGVSSLTVNAHLLSCPACADELDRMKSSITGFRGAAHAWGENALIAAENRTSRARVAENRPRRARWMVAMAAMILFLAGSAAYLRHQPAVSQKPATVVATSADESRLSQAQLDQDNQLLSQVNGELSEAVPAPMQPLVVSESGQSNSSLNK